MGVEEFTRARHVDHTDPPHLEPGGVVVVVERDDVALRPDGADHDLPVVAGHVEVVTFLDGGGLHTHHQPGMVRPDLVDQGDDPWIQLGHRHLFRHQVTTLTRPRRPARPKIRCRCPTRSHP